MRHNTLFNKVTPPPKHFTKPKKVVTVPVTGNLGKGLTREQYQGILGSIDNLNEATAVQRKEYDAYVDYNEKATVRSDYNIADITKLAKSLERLIDDLQKKWKVQEKWNAYFKQALASLSENNDINILVDDKVSMLEQKIKDLEDQLNSLDLNSLVVEYTQNNESSSKYIQNLLRVLQQLPGIVTDIEAICTKAEGGFTIKYKTVKLSDIDLDAELPEPEPDPNEPKDPEPEIPYPEDPDNEESGEYDEDKLGKPKDPKGTDAVKSKQTEVELSSPTDFKFKNLFADNVTVTNTITAETSEIKDVNASIQALSDGLTALAAAIQ